MIIVTTDFISDKKLQTLGLVKGSCVMTVHAGKDIFNSFKTLVGGELESYTDMMNSSRQTATDRMISEAKTLNADAIIAVRYSSSGIMQSAAEVSVCGTAVKFLN